MSVFSLIKRSRQQAKEHNQKQADKAKEAPKQAYRHVPTHAAVDALSGAPSSWKHDDRPRIIEQNRRRSAMAASGLGHHRMPGPSLPRVSSSLSHVTYPSSDASPAGQMPRAYSYSGVPPPMPWENRNKNPSLYSVPDASRISLKGKELDRSYESGRNSPTSIKAGSPVGSSSQSTSSQEDLEMKPSRHTSMPPHSAGSSEAPRNAAIAIHAHRLHPSSRRASDASDRADFSPKNLQPSPPSDKSRPPPSTRGFNSIPPVTSLPPMHFGNTLNGQPPNMPLASSSASTRSSAQGSFSSFNFNVNNAPFSAPMSGRSSAATTPAACVTPEPVYESLEEEEEASAYTYAPASTTAPSAMKQKDRRGISKSKVTRFTELETIDSHTEQIAIPSVAYEQACRDTTPPQVSHNAISKAAVVEMVTAAPAEVTSAQKQGKRLSKQPGSKVAKKSRWSIKSSAVAV
ncbi:uncharacterized protein CTRU02_202203 [Colletotrichum truncatum]|uniref:Uncharacterized protein n=1 Tax=Colletotrichum truncatum TaxID=5467 RepID=A0ACC3ZJL8_COLTU|nr:uncharacterized protein CTRU02_01365 [Colletotrichum truncatum]KAF6799686.1 hypothetical protein CTRU02_01365 [Colletotrichum truncatum]